jgi:apolipoprotein N-acyltransferase
LQAKKKKYPNPLIGKGKILAIISIVLIVAISYGLFFYLENTNEENIRNSIIQREIGDQLKDMQSLSRHISSDLTLIYKMDNILAY